MTGKRNEALRLRWFTRLAGWASNAAGRPATFGVAVTLLVFWALVGPLFHFSDSWQLVVNTATTIITFLMVFLIQHTQNRDTTSIQIKLDELIRVSDGRNALIPLEDLDDEELEQLRAELRALAKRGSGPGVGRRRAPRREAGRRSDDSGDPPPRAD